MKFLVFCSALIISNFALALGNPSLTWSDPKVIVATSDKVKLEIRGNDFENEGHPSRGQYMHWQIRRSGGAWNICIESRSSADGTCKTTGWSNNLETFELSGKYVNSPGTLEFRLARGLDNEDSADPTKSTTGASVSGWTNILKVPVIAEPPVITSIEPSELPNTKLPKGTPADKLFTFRINGKNFGKNPSAHIGNFNDGMKVVAHTDTYVDVILPTGHRPKGPEEKELPVKVANVEYNLATEPVMIKIHGEAPKKLNIGAPAATLRPAATATTVQTQAQPETVKAQPQPVQPQPQTVQPPPKLIQPGTIQQPTPPKVPTLGH